MVLSISAGSCNSIPEVDDWIQFEVFFADINDDGRDDIIWNHAAATNKTYVGLGK